MPFQYNGIVLQEPLFTVDRTQKVITDAAKNYLHTEHRCHVRATYNPATTSYRGAAISVGGQLPAITEAAVRHQLQQSRGSLIIQDGAGNTILQSPAPGASVDANNGPVTEVNRVTAQYGNKTFIVDFVVTTWINESSLFVTTPSVLVSHTYQMRHSFDTRSMLCVREVHGEGVFRPDRLAALGAVPDDFRHFLFLPVPNNFRRANVEVVQDADSCNFAYHITDVEMRMNINPALGVTLIEGFWAQRMSGIGRAEWDWRELLSEEGLFVSGVASSPGLYENIRYGGGAGRVGAAISIGTMAVNAQLRNKIFQKGNSPHVDHTISVDVWGDRNASTQTLRNVAKGVIGNRVNTVFAQQNALFTGAEGDINTSIHNGFVRATLQVIGPPINVAGGNGANALNIPMNVFELMNFGNDDVPGYLTVGGGVNPAPSGDGVSRGTYAGRCVAAALLSQNAVPPSPPDPAQANVLAPP